MAETELVGPDVAREIHEIHEMLTKLMPLVERAAPLLDSPMVKLASSPMGAKLASSPVFGMLKGPRRG
ncbi:hypothetical protein [Kitasatospora sp. NPDC057198]|uniref:hypothetical protein n=1 Tax=Kitasatospora sp. NPDC057198 TaxID=3346046 RepID=UPI00362A29E2